MDLEQVPFSKLIANVVDNRGRTCPTSDHGIPLIATNCVRNDLLYPTYEKARFVAQETYATWFRGHPQPGDILFVNKGTPGRVCLVPDPVDFCIAQDMVAIRADKSKVYPKYLFAALRSSVIQEQIVQMHVGTLIPHFKKGDFDKLLIPLPSKRMQVSIGDAYFVLSAKIDLIRKMSATLEAIARALFKSWFVDFYPVRAKMEGRDSGLPSRIADLFPSRLVRSELGEMPHGWSVKGLLEVARLISGGTPKTEISEYWNGDIEWASAKDVSQCNQSFLIETERRITELGLNNSSTRLVPARATVVVARGATTGRFTMFGHQMAMNQTCYALHSKSGHDYWLNGVFANIIAALVQAAHGSVFDTITTRTLEAGSVVDAGSDLKTAYETAVTPIFEQIKVSLEQSRTLGALRDLLLPKLISGEFRVKDAETLLERVL